MLEVELYWWAWVVDWKGGEFSSSEESAGVTVCVKRGEGRLRNCERERMCRVLGEVRKGNVDLFGAGQQCGLSKDYLQH